MTPHDTPDDDGHGDSVNVARNASRGYCPGCKSHMIDVVNGPVAWPGSVFF